MAPEALWFPFVVSVALFSHFERALVAVCVESKKRQTALAEISFLNPLI